MLQLDFGRDSIQAILDYWPQLEVVILDEAVWMEGRTIRVREGVHQLRHAGVVFDDIDDNYWEEIGVWELHARVASWLDESWGVPGTGKHSGL